MLKFPALMIYGESQLQWLLPGVRDAFNKTRTDALAEGITIKVADFGGARTPAIVQQLINWRDAAVAQGEPYYRVSTADKGKHVVGGAVDFRVTGRPSGMSESQAYARVGALGRPHGLLWGGTFSDPADPWHLESQQSRAQLQARWDEWVKSPDYPRMGFAEWSVLAVIALIVVAFIFYRYR